MTQDSRHYIYFSLAAVILVVAGMIWFVLMPAVRKNYLAKDELEMKKNDFEKIISEAARSRKYALSVKELHSQRGLLEESMIRRDSVVAFIEDLEKISNQTGCQIEISSFEPPKKKPTALVLGSEKEDEGVKPEEKQNNQIYLQLKIESDYRSLMKFIYLLENMPKVFNVDEMELKKNSQAGGLVKSDRPADFLSTRIVLSFVPYKDGSE